MMKITKTISLTSSQKNIMQQKRIPFFWGGFPYFMIVTIIILPICCVNFFIVQKFGAKYLWFLFVPIQESSSMLNHHLHLVQQNASSSSLSLSPDQVFAIIITIMIIIIIIIVTVPWSCLYAADWLLKSKSFYSWKLLSFILLSSSRRKSPHINQMPLIRIENEMMDILMLLIKLW